jgi:acyl-CoA thioester hydrolase
MPASITTDINVRYAETDAQGVVHHANYLVWFELGRSSWLKAHGLRYAEWEKSGLFVVVAEATIRYRAPAFYDDCLKLTTTLLKVRGRYFEFAYEVHGPEGKLLADGTTRHLVTSRDRTLAQLPADMLEGLKRAIT